MSLASISPVTGKKGEMKFIQALIEKGLTPFIPIVDLGIDCVAEKNLPNKQLKYYAFQVKTSSMNNTGWGWYIDEWTFRNNPNVYYIFILEGANKLSTQISHLDPSLNLCIIPSKDIQKGHWSPYNKKNNYRSFDVRITSKMLKEIQTYKNKKNKLGNKTNSAIALSHLNDWSQL